MLIRTVVVTPFAQNARVLIDESSREATVIDPGGDIEQIAALLVLDNEPVSVTQIFLTHSHIDHAGGVRALQRRLVESQGRAAVLLAHPLERQMRALLPDTARMFGLSSDDYESVPEPDVSVEHGAILHVGKNEARLLFTPGHSPGHLAAYFADFDGTLEQEGKGERFRGPLVIGGDVLFAGTIGRTDLPGGDHATLLRSVREQLFTLPPETRVLCGHGPDTEIGVEIRTNPFFRT